MLPSYSFAAAERRTTLRLLSYWEKMRAGRDMPTEEDINPSDIEDLWNNCFLVHVADLKKPDYNYTYLGEDIKKAYLGKLLEEIPDMEVPPNTMHVREHFERIIATGKPLVKEGEFLNAQGETLRYRQCLLPLGKNGQVLAIFGGMRLKTMPTI